jgi:hypothetical protein
LWTYGGVSRFDITLREEYTVCETNHAYRVCANTTFMKEEAS